LLQFIGEQLGLGVVVGIAIGLIGGWLLRFDDRRGWMAESFQQIAVVTSLPSVLYRMLLRPNSCLLRRWGLCRKAARAG